MTRDNHIVALLSGAISVTLVIPIAIKYKSSVEEAKQYDQ